MKNRNKGKLAERVQVQLPPISFDDATKQAIAQVDDPQNEIDVVHRAINILRHHSAICFPHADWELWDLWAHRGQNQKIYFEIKLKVLWKLREHCSSCRMAMKAIKQQIAVIKKRQKYTELGENGYLQC